MRCLILVGSRICTDRDVNRFAGSCGSHKQTSLLVRHQLLHEECVPHCVNSRYYDLIESHLLQNTTSTAIKLWTQILMGAFFWDYSGIGLLEIDGIRLLLGANPFLE